MQEIEINKLYPNSWNPNKMPKGTFKKLKASIKTIGLLNPVLVRQKGTNYEIVDGQWRWEACKELGFQSILCRIIEATDEQVKKIIFASTIKGRHNAFESREVLKDFVNIKNSEDLLSVNLDRLKLERKTKYINYTKGQPIKKGEKHLIDESIGLPSIDNYTIVLSIPLKKTEYEQVKDVLNKIDKNWSNAMIKLCQITEVPDKNVRD